MGNQFMNPQRRIGILLLCFSALFLVLAARLFDLQIRRGTYFEDVAAAQRMRASELLPHRGAVYVTEGRTGSKEQFPIATNQQAWIAYAEPVHIKDPAGVARELAPELYQFRQRQNERVKTILATTGQPPREEGAPSPTPLPDVEIETVRQELETKFSKANDPYEVFLKSYEFLDDQLKAFLEDKQYAGIRLEEEEARIYPEKTLAAHLLGYVGNQDERRVGRYGLEGFFEHVLAGDLGFLSSEKDTSGQAIGIGAYEFTPAQNGADVFLTIDRVVQSAIEEELKAGVEKYGAEGGSVLVMNPKTGAVLGMATYPTFDPNYYYAIADPRVQLNPVVSDLFEPGSILKPVIMAAAMEEGKVEPDTTFVDNGPVKVAEYTINTFDGKHHGVQSMTQVLEQSNNVGMVWVGQQLGAELLYDYFRRFGLGEKTGIELEGETQRELPDPSQWNVTTVATTSFGQGIALTPLQALNAINVLANDGRLMRPYVVEKIRRSSGAEELEQPQVVGEVVSSMTAEKLSAMMVSVIENGVAGLARVPGYYLAGKTGTAQVPDDRGKYSPDRKIISFVGFGPVEDPRFSILIKLNNPAGLSFASGTAAPMFKNISERLIKYYQIPPSYDPTTTPRFEVTPKTEPNG